MSNIHRLFPLVLLAPLSLACVEPKDDVLDTESGETEADETETGEMGPVDSDEDGLTDDEEADLGTDPLKKDTDGDNYWDPWELIEGTDPVDYDSRIYRGFWPYNPDKDLMDPGSWSTASTTKDSRFPRDVFEDHHGDFVDLYDFTNFTYNDTGQPAYFIFDLSAQWCGPCHNVANWLSGNIDGNNQWIEDTYPTVREKVHNLRIWWMTFIVEDNNGAPPTLSDATSWYQVHTDPYVPVLVDADQNVLQNYSGGAFPHFFLLNPDMTLEYFPPPNASTNEDPYPAVGLVDKFL